MTERALAKSISKKFVKGGAEGGVAGLGCQDSSSGCARNQLNRNYAYDMCANGKQLSLFRGIIAVKLNLKLLVPSSQSYSFFLGRQMCQTWRLKVEQSCFNICQEAYMQANKISLAINCQLGKMEMHLQVKRKSYKYFI